MPEGYCSCLVQNLFSQYVVHMLKLQCHYVSLDKFYNLNVIVPAALYSKVRAIFAIRPVHLYGEICFQCHCLVHCSHVKLQSHNASFDKFYNSNVWSVLASLYSKVRVIFLLGLYIYIGRNLFSV